MNISDLLSESMVLCQHNTSSKKRVLEDIAEHISQQLPDIDSNTLFSALIAREKLGSTGIGNGIAIPHCRINQCKQNIIMLLTLDKAIDFDAIDGENVDIICVLLVPEDANENHLKTLASIAQTFSDKDVLSKARKARSANELLESIAQ